MDHEGRASAGEAHLLLKCTACAVLNALLPTATPLAQPVRQQVVANVGTSSHEAGGGGY